MAKIPPPIDDKKPAGSAPAAGDSVTGKVEHKRKPLHEAIRALREAGGDAWDHVEDPEKLLRELRG